MNIAVGMITVASRVQDDITQKTLKNLCDSGFPSIHAFVDGAGLYDLQWPNTIRQPPMGNFGNWYLSATELYIRNPRADAYLMFEDDVIPCNNLRTILEREPMCADGYHNLYCTPENERFLRNPKPGWYSSLQHGHSALALMFDRKALLKILASSRMQAWPRNEERGTWGVDGAILMAAQGCGIEERVHYPSLVQHAEFPTTIKNRPPHMAERAKSESFRYDVP